MTIDKTFHACVDLGGTKVAVCLVADSVLRVPSDTINPHPPALLAHRVEPTAKEGKHDTLAQQIIRMTDAACADMGIVRSAIASMGVSSCGPFVLRDGLVELAAPNICGGLAGTARGLPNDWTSAPLQAPLQAVFGKVRVENDAIGALEAERRWGALRGFNHCAYVTWSTGIGMGLCVDGHVLRGKNGNAGHAGHMFVSDNQDALCGCGNIGDVEGLVAGNAMPRRFGQDAASLLAAARAGNDTVVTQVNDLCRVMGRALYNLVITLDLQRISIGGSMFWHHQDYLLPLLQSHVQGKFAPLTNDCAIVPAGLGLGAGDYGALALVG